MSRYQTFGHAKTHLRYHLIFSTKYRRKALAGIEDAVIESLRYVESKSNFRIHAIGIDQDHIHLVVSFKPNHSLTQIVRRIKQMSTRQLWETQAPHLRNHYWGTRVGKLWTGGYFAETIGPVSEDKILNYVKNQGHPTPHQAIHARG